MHALPHAAFARPKISFCQFFEKIARTWLRTPQNLVFWWIVDFFEESHAPEFYGCPLNTKTHDFVESQPEWGDKFRKKGFRGVRSQVRVILHKIQKFTKKRDFGACGVRCVQFFSKTDKTRFWGLRMRRVEERAYFGKSHLWFLWGHFTPKNGIKWQTLIDGL